MQYCITDKCEVITVTPVMTAMAVFVFFPFLVMLLKLRAAKLLFLVFMTMTNKDLSIYIRKRESVVPYYNLTYWKKLGIIDHFKAALINICIFF